MAYLENKNYTVKIFLHLRESYASNDLLTFGSYTTVGQRNYFTTSVTVLYKLPLVAALVITGKSFLMPGKNICDCRKVRKNIVK